MTITPYQRRVLVEHAIETNGAYGTPTPETAFTEVIADLAMGREVSDRDQLVSFLWRQVSIAVDAGASRRAHWVWSAAVQLLDECGEDLDDIFTGREIVIGDLSELGVARGQGRFPWAISSPSASAVWEARPRPQAPGESIPE